MQRRKLMLAKTNKVMINDLKIIKTLVVLGSEEFKIGTENILNLQN